MIRLVLSIMDTDVLNSLSDQVKKGINLSELVGEGSYGKVYKWKINDKVYAVKRMDFYSSLEEFCRLKLINHPNVIHPICLYHMLDVDDVCCSLIVMPLYSKTLKQLIDDKTISISVENKVNIVKCIVSGLASLHAQLICHGDVKPDNILINENNNEVVLCDLSVSVQIDGLQTNYQEYGTLWFRPPEGLISEKDYSINNKWFSMDVWALGNVVAYILNRYYLFKKDDEEKQYKMIVDVLENDELKNRISNESQLLHDLCLKTIVFNPNDRATIKEVFKMMKMDIEQSHVKRNDIFTKPVYEFSDSVIRMRRILYEWIIEVCCQYNSTHYVCIMTLLMNDQLLSKGFIEHTKLQLNGIASYSVANETIHTSPYRYDIDEMVYICGNTYNEKEMENAVRSVSNILGSNILNTIPIYSKYVDYFRNKEYVKRFIELYCSELGVRLTIDELVTRSFKHNYLEGVKNKICQIVKTDDHLQFTNWLKKCENQYMSKQYLTPFEDVDKNMSDVMIIEDWFKQDKFEIDFSNNKLTDYEHVNSCVML